MKTLRSTFIVLSFVALALIVAPVALAGTETFSTTIGPTLTNFSGQTGTVAQFDPTLGTLYQVIITLNGGGTTDITATGNNPASPTNFTQLATSVAMQLTDPTDGSISLIASELGGVPGLGAYTPLVVVNGTPYDSGVLAMTGTPVDQTLTSSLTSFIGGGNVTFDLAAIATTTTSSTGGVFTVGQTTEASGGVTVEYDYNPPPPPSGTPEPGTLTLFGTGLLGLAGMLRRKFAK